MLHLNMPPQAGECKKLSTPSLPSRFMCCAVPSPFVSKSACWSFVFAWTALTTPSLILFRMKWQSISIWFVLSCRMRFSSIWMVDVLSLKVITGELTWTPNSLNSPNNHVSSVTATTVLCTQPHVNFWTQLADFLISMTSSYLLTSQHTQ